MAMRRWEPATGMLSLRDAMNRLMEESFVSSPLLRAGMRAFVVPMDVFERDDELIVRAALPGAKANEVDITITGDTLMIRGVLRSMAESGEASNWNWFRHEMPHGEFSRTITLPYQVDANRAQATFEDGILTLTLPKAEAAKTKHVAVQARGEKAPATRSTRGAKS